MTSQLLLQSSLLLAIVGAYEWRLRAITHKVSKVPCRAEVERIVDTKVEVVKLRHDDLREDIRYLREVSHRLEQKIDLLIAKGLKA